MSRNALHVDGVLPRQGDMSWSAIHRVLSVEVCVGRVQLVMAYSIALYE